MAQFLLFITTSIPIVTDISILFCIIFAVEEDKRDKTTFDEHVQELCF